jgi:hypothetical protein
MAKGRSQFDATPSLLGFLYQTRFALLLALRRNDPEVVVSIESLDDIAFAKNDASGLLSPIDVRQLKHHLSRHGGLGNRSADIWKTLRVWADAITSKRLDPLRTLLFLVTTSTATKSHAISTLSPKAKVRDTEQARSELESSGAASTDKTIQVAFQEYLKLSDKRRKQMFAAIHLLDGSSDVGQLRTDIETEVRLVTDPQHRTFFTDALEGWWFRLVIEHLMTTSHCGIRIGQVEMQVRELSEQFRRGNLPDELANAIVPNAEKQDGDNRMFVQQLRLIGLTDRRIGTAQEDHYRAYEQRSRWLRKDLLGMNEIPQLEARLSDEWKRRFDIMLEGISSDQDEPVLQRSGQALFHWVELDAPQNPTLFVRPEFRSPYMTRGSFHMLADKKRVGWHPEFDSRLNADGGTGDAS